MDLVRPPHAKSTSDLNTGTMEMVAGHVHKTDLDDGRWHVTQQDNQLLLDSEDDSSLGTDALVFMSGIHPSSQGLSLATSEPGYSCDSFIELNQRAESGNDSHEVPHEQKRAQLGRRESFESFISDLSDISRSSHDVSSLLNAMAVDPEDVLSNLGFAEPDLRMRIPERFLRSPSKARGIDVEYFRMSLEFDDVHGSPSLQSSTWSDPGFNRLPLRFINAPMEPTDVILGQVNSSVPIITEPEDISENTFDLMRHLRLNKPQHVTKGRFLEPLVEELEVSSVGSGTVRTRLSRKLSNEDGTIVREGSLEKANFVEVSSDIPPGTDLNDRHRWSSEVEDDIGIVSHVENDQILEKSSATCLCLTGGIDEERSVSHEGLYSDHTVVEKEQFGSAQSDYNENYLVRNPSGGKQQKIPEFSVRASVPLPHLKVASIEIQDSFELEEIGPEYSSDKDLSCAVDHETSAIVKSEKRLTRENSGESSGFEEMLPDKDTSSPCPASPAYSIRNVCARSQIVNSDRRPLQALLDPDVLRSKLEASPQIISPLRRTRSLTKQPQVCEEFLTPDSCDINPGQESCLVGIKGQIGASSTGTKGVIATDSELYHVTMTTTDWFVESHQEDPPRICKKNVLEVTGHLDTSSCRSYGKESPPLLSDFSCLGEYENSASKASEFCSRANVDINSGNDHQGQRYNLTGTAISDQLRYENVIVESGSTDSLSSSYEGKSAAQLKRPSPHSDDEELAGACAEGHEEAQPHNALRKIDSEFNQLYLTEIDVLEESIHKYQSSLSVTEQLDSVKTTGHSKKILMRLTDEINAVREIRALISGELERMKHLLEERRILLITGVSKDPLCPEVSQRMADLLREQSSLRTRLTNIGDELSIRRKASRRARLNAYIDSAKKELREERERCKREFREEIKETVVREVSEKFASEIEQLRREVRCKDVVIEKLKTIIDRDEIS